MVIIPQTQHNLSKNKINTNALKVLYQLKKGGFDAYLVGGCVRDLLLGLEPKDFDIATNAAPEEVRKLFRNCRLIGRRFRLAHIYFGRQIIEVATFRGKTQHHHPETGMILRDNIYGTIEEDAWRRDFTINALYYNSKDFSIVDFTGGMQDLNNKIIRIIGEPEQRYHEDPVRILRALRLSAKLNFALDPATKKPIKNLVGLLQNVPRARLFDELLKWFASGHSFATFKLLRKYGLFAVLFTQTEAVLTNEQHMRFVAQGFINTDQRIAEQKSLNPAFLFAVLLWQSLQNKIIQYQRQRLRLFPAIHQAVQEVLHQQTEHVAIPLRFKRMIKEIWLLQYRLQQKNPKKTTQIMQQPRFRAAYDFLLLRAEAGEKVKALANLWTQVQEKS
jgi:poly(A) polymerase